MSVFAQLKTLAKNLDQNVEKFQKSIGDDSLSSSKGSKSSVGAVNELHHRIKEMKELRAKVESTHDDFERRNVTFDQVINLYGAVLEGLSARTECVEDHLAQYGYKKLTSKEEESESYESDHEGGGEYETRDSEETESVDKSNTGILLSSPHPTKILSEPKLENFVSANTLLLLKETPQKSAAPSSFGKVTCDTPVAPSPAPCVLSATPKIEDVPQLSGTGLKPFIYTAPKPPKLRFGSSHLFDDTSHVPSSLSSRQPVSSAEVPLAPQYENRPTLMSAAEGNTQMCQPTRFPQPPKLVSRKNCLAPSALLYDGALPYKKETDDMDI